MASVVASSGVLCQCQTVAGPATGLGYGDSRGLSGTSLAPVTRSRRRQGRSSTTRPLIVAMAGKKKVNAYDEEWSKKFFGYGYFAENSEEDQANLLKKLEKKKLLTNIEKAGLLSKLEGFGFSLSKIEKLGLLSKAESFGLLGLAESFAATSPAALASIALPLVVGAVLTPIIVPDDNVALLYGQYIVATLFGVAGLGAFGGSIVLGILQEE